ncbi:solute carrier family 2, facilitated glucose transporter member 8-like isoform X2 [Anneissia japonica]|nr:solute carrier family 2, facilitated glucose transporter member 8-like isoform X2 [Anneissia japonica]XP_033110239.1 solute carrier family 2, facilitated glucose transporter member 8-like isoform X2 [Anneissia japonica]
MNKNLYVAAFVALLGPAMMGYTMAYTSPAIPDMESRELFKTTDQISWFGSLLAVGAIVGGPIAGFCVHNLGRKYAMMLCSLPFVVGYGLIASIDNLATLYTGRILTGIGTGMASLTTPVYIAELSRPDLRGMLVGGFQLFLCVGILLVNALGISLSYVWLAAVGCAISTLLGVLMMFMPETPHYCIMKHKMNKALSVLTLLRGGEYNVNHEYKDIADDIRSKSDDFQCKEFFKPNLYIPLVISVILMMFVQFSGINAVGFYTVTIFQKSSPSVDGNVAVVIVTAAQVVATIVSVLLIDRIGRKILLIMAGMGMCLSASAFGLYYKLTENTANGTSINDVNYTESTSIPPISSDLTWLSLTSVIVYTSSFSFAWGAVPLVVVSEILPTRAKGPASAIAITVAWLSAFVVTKEFFKMSVVMSDAGVFWFFGGVCLLSVIFVALCVPETKGRSLEEISKHFQRNLKRARAASSVGKSGGPPRGARGNIPGAQT